MAALDLDFTDILPVRNRTAARDPRAQAFLDEEEKRRQAEELTQMKRDEAARAQSAAQQQQQENALKLQNANGEAQLPVALSDIMELRRPETVNNQPSPYRVQNFEQLPEEEQRRYVNSYSPAVTAHLPEMWHKAAGIAPKAEPGESVQIDEFGREKRTIRNDDSIFNLQDQDAKAEDIAGAIERGEQPPTMSGLYRYGAAVRSKLAAKGFDLATATQDWKATERHLATLNGPQQVRIRQATQFAHDSLDIIDDLSAKWKAGNYPLLNKGKLLAAKQGALGPDAQSIATQLEGQINDMVAELGIVYQGGNSATNNALKLAEKNLSADYSEKTLRDMTGLLRKNLQIRLNSLNNSQPAGVSQTQAYTPSGERVPATAAAPAAPTAPTPQKTGTEIIERNGKRYEVNHATKTVREIR